MERWLSKWAPLSGALAGILIAVSIFSGGSTPGDNARVSQIVGFYLHNATGQKVSDICGTLGLAFFVLFAVSLAGRLRAAGAGGWLAYGAAACAVFAALALALLLAFSWVLAADIKFLTPSAAQALNVLENDFFLPTVAGFFVFGVVAGLASVISRVPVRWMGWVLFAFGIGAVVPPVTFFAFLLIFLWSLATGIWLVAQGPPDVTGREPDIRLAASSVGEGGS